MSEVNNNYSSGTSLEALKARINNLKSLISLSPSAIVQEKLDALFFELKNLLNPNELEQAVEIMGDATQILETKLSEIEHYVSILLQRDKLKDFLQNTDSENALASIINNAWQEPLVIPAFSIEYLQDWYKKLKIPRKRTQCAETEQLPMIPLERDSFQIDGIEDPFETRMLRYLEDVRPLLPNTLDNILAGDKSGDTYFEHFTYILHLLQNGYLLFDRERKQFSIIPQECDV
jgi:hypothetical protein